MTDIKFTKHDFNDLVNFGDLRAGEVSIEHNGMHIDSWHYSTNFVSTHDLIVDYVSARKVKDLLKSAETYCVKIARDYPWHEAFINDCIALSRKHQFAYSPVLIANKNTDLESMPAAGGLPGYVKILPNQCDMNVMEDSELANFSNEELLVVYRPNEKVQSELHKRIFRQKAQDTEPEPEPKSSKAERIEKIIESASPSSNDAILFNKTLLQLWPCGAYGRLSSYIYLKENCDSLIASPVEWNFQVEKGGIRDIGGELISFDGTVSREIAAKRTAPKRSYNRSKETDKLCLKGIMAYHRDEGWRNRGWPIVGSSLDPFVSVRTDGIYRWMALPHGGIEGMEKVGSGENVTVGAAFIENELRELLKGDILFAGLGLGVIQRRICSTNRVVTLENNPAVLEIFNKLYPLKNNNHHIIEGDFFTVFGGLERLWDCIVIDFFDENDRVLDTKILVDLLSVLKLNGTIIINHNGKDDGWSDKLCDRIAATGAQLKLHMLEYGQMVAVISMKN